MRSFFRMITWLAVIFWLLYLDHRIDKLEDHQDNLIDLITGLSEREDQILLLIGGLSNTDANLNNSIESLHEAGILTSSILDDHMTMLEVLANPAAVEWGSVTSEVTVEPSIGSVKFMVEPSVGSISLSDGEITTAPGILFKE